MTYMIETPHTEAECLKALDEQLELGADLLDKFYFGCAAGDHTGYAILDVTSEEEARKLVPKSLVEKSLFTKVEKFTPEMIKAFHAKSAAA